MNVRHFSLLCLATATLGGLTSCTTMQGGTGSSVPNAGPVIPGVASYVVADMYDGHVVMALGADVRRPIASLTKIATAVAVLEFIRSAGIDAGEMMVVPQQVQLLGAPGPAQLSPGDTLSIRDGLAAAMIGSDNFAAETLALHIGQKLAAAGVSSNPMSAFVNQMNGLTSRAALRDTKFANAHGLETANQKGYSTAADVARLTMYALKVPGFSYYSSQLSRTISVSGPGGSRSINLRNTNELLGRGKIDGVKTGLTTLAGPCLALSASRPATVIKRADGSTVVIPHRLIVVELGATDRFNQGWTLLQQGWAQYDAWRNSGSLPGSSLHAATPAQ